MYHDIIRFFPKTKERIFEICAPLYEQGLSLREIERRTGFAKSSIKTTLNQGGLPLRNAAKSQLPFEPKLESMRSGITPYGFCYLEGKMVVDTREHAVVLQIMKWWHSGKNFAAITELLNRQKIRSRTGKTWTHSVVSAVVKRQLKNETKK